RFWPRCQRSATWYARSIWRSVAASALGSLPRPDTLPAPGDEPVLSCDQMPGAMENGWSGFFHRTHRLLPRDGVLLLATRQRRDAGRLTDPLGSLIASARTAGFRYLQHIVIIHGHPDGDRIVPTPPEDAPPGLIHSDLLVLSAITSA
ncbi:hypothetical protein ACWEWX_55030, partial [Streptomyces asiaticus]